MAKKTKSIIKGNTHRVKPSEYLKNVTRSVAYISVDTMGSMNPAIKNLADSNSDISKMLYEGVKDYKSVLKTAKSTIRESEYYKIGKTGFQNAIDDLRTGKFYNKEREDAVETKLAMGGDSDDFFDFDFDMDFNFDDNESDETIDKGDKLIAKEIDSSSRAMAGAIGQTTIQSAKYLAETQKASTKMLYDQNNRLLGSLNLGMGSVAASMQQIVAHQQNINTHIENSKTFYAEATSQMKTTNELLVRILENQEKSIADGKLQDDRKDRLSYSDIDNGMGGIDLKNYFKYLKKNAKNMSGGYLDMMGMFQGGNILESFAASPWKTVTEVMVNKAIPEIVKQASNSLNESVTGLFASLQGLLTTLPGGEDNILYKLLHVDNKLKTSIDTSKYNKAAQAWNGVDHKALTEVIPDQLSEIISLLSGREKRLFDYDKGVYKNVSSIKKEYEDNLNSEALRAASDLRTQMQGIMDNISFSSKSMQEDLQKAMNTMFQNAFRNGTFLNVWDPNFDMTELGVSSREARYLKSMLKATDRSKQMAYNLKQREGRAAWTKMMEEQELGNSIYRHKYNNSELQHIKTDKQGRVIMEKDSSLIGSMHLNRQTDKLGHNVFYYLQNINKELTYIRQSNGYVPGAGGRGGYGRNVQVTRRDANGRERTSYLAANGKRLRYEDIKIEDIRSKDAQQEIERELREKIKYNEKQEKRLKDNPGLKTSEYLDDLDEAHLDRSIKSIAEEIREREKITNIKTPRTFATLDQLIKAETFSEKVSVINNNFRALLQKPGQILASSMEAADKALYTIVYGDKRDKNGRRKGFMNEMMDQMKLSFIKFHNWMDSLFDPLKERLGVNQFREIPGKVFEKFFGMSPHEAYIDFKKYLFGEFEEGADGNKYRVSNGILTGITDGIKEAFNDAGDFLHETFKPIKDFVDGKKKPKQQTTNNEEEIIINPITGLVTSSNSIPTNVLNSKRVSVQDIANQAMNEMLGDKYKGVKTPKYDNSYVSLAQTANLLTEQDKAEITKTFTGIDDSIDNISSSLGNTENILEDILDAVISIGSFIGRGKKGSKFSFNKRDRFSYQNVYSRDEIMSEFDGYEGYIEGMAYGGRVLKSGPVILSEGEYVFNPADARTKRKQAANEARIARKLGLGSALRMAEGGTVKFDESNPHFINERKIGRKKYKVFGFDNGEFYYNGQSYVKIGDTSGTMYRPSEDGSSMVAYKLKDRGPIGLSKIRKDVKDGVYEEGEEPLAYKMYETTSNATNQILRAIGVSKDDEDKLGKATADVMRNIKEYAPYMIGTGLIGGGVSLVTGMVGGPLLGAASGAAIGLIKKSEKVQDWLFGEIGKDGSREGGFISKNVQDTVSKYLPDMTKGGVLGGTAGLLTGLISPLGPVGGIMVGSALGFAKNNDDIKKTLFGDNWEENSAKFKNKLKSLIPGMAVGALTGVGALHGSIGLFPAAILGTLGGWAASTEKMKRLLFGKLQEDGTRDNTGLFGAVKSGIVDPIKENSKKLFDDIRGWIKNDIINPVKRSMDPIFKSVTNLGKGILGFLGNKIGNSMDRGFSAVLAKYLKDNFFGKHLKRAGWVGTQLFSPAKALISSPFRAIGAVGDHLRAKQIAKGQADYMSAAERLQFRSDRKNKKGFLRGRLKNDQFSRFDQYLNTASEEQLLDLRSQLKEFQDPDKFYLDKSAEAETELRNSIYALNNGVEFDDAYKIEKAIKDGNYDKARRIIGNAPGLDPYTRDQLMHSIFEAGANYNSIEEQRSKVKREGRLSLGAIRATSNGLFKGLKSYKDLDKYKGYLNKEINIREQKSDVEKQTEAQERQHIEVVELFKQANDRLRALTDPDFAKELNKKERHKAITAANKKYGFGGSFSNRDQSSLMYDYRVNPETGGSELTYIGPGSIWHKREHADDYDSNGNYKYHGLKGPNAVANAKHGHWASNNINDIAYMYEQQGMSPKEARAKAKEDYIKNEKGIKNNIKGFINRRSLVRSAHSEIEITNYAKELAISDGNSEESYIWYMDQAREALAGRFGRIKRSGRKLASSLNYQNTRNALRNHYANTMSDEEANQLADNQMAEASKKPWFRFVGLRRFKMKTDADGSPVIDMSDANSVRNRAEIDKAEEVQSKTYTVFSSIDNSIKGFFNRLFGKGDDDEGKTPLWKKFLKGGLKVMGVWTMLSLGPYLKKFWQDTVGPKIGGYISKVVEPIAPAIENIALKLDNFFLNTFPNTLKNTVTGITSWLTGSGEYEGAGLPYVFKNEIVPFYMGGIEFLMQDIIPSTVGLFVKHLPAMLLNTAKNIGKVWSWSLEDLINGKSSKSSNSISISSKEIIDDINNYSYTPKTGPAYSLYKSMFGSSGSSVTGDTYTISRDTSGSSNDSGSSSGNGGRFARLKTFLGLNKTSSRSSNIVTSVSNASSAYITNNGTYVPSYSNDTYTGEVSSDGTLEGIRIVDNGDGTASATDKAGNNYGVTSDGSIYVMDSSGSVARVNTNQSWTWSSADNKYHSVDADGNDVALSLPDYLGTSLTTVKSSLYASLQDDAARGKSVAKQFAVGATRGHVGGAIIRSATLKSSGLVGLLSKAGAKSGLLVRSATFPIRLIGNTSKIVANASTEVSEIATKSISTKKAAQAALKNAAENSVDDVTKSATKVGSEALGEAAENALEKAGREAVENTGEAAVKKTIRSKLGKYLCNSKIMGLLSKSCADFSETRWIKAMDNFAEKLSEKLGLKIASKGVKSASKFLGKFTPIAIVTIVWDFLNGWNNARKNLGIATEATIGMKALSGIITVVNSYVTLGLLPESVIFDLLISLNPMGMFDDVIAAREKSDDFLSMYNEINGTNYTNINEYNNATQKSLWQKIKSFGIDDGTKEKEQKAWNAVASREQYQAIQQASTRTSTKSTLSYLSDVTVPSGSGSGLTQYTSTPNKIANDLQHGTFISQYDSQFANTPFNISSDTKKQTIADAGCGPASAAMVVNDAIHGVDKTSKENLDRDSLMNESIKYALNSKYKVANGGVVPEYFTDYFRSKGLTATKYTSSADITNQLETGSRMVVLGQDKSNKSKENSPFGPNGHYVVVNGMSKDGRYVFVNDPELSVSNVPYSKNLFFKGVQMGIKAVNQKSGYNIGKDYSVGKGTIYNDPDQAALYQDLCSWSSLSEATLKSAMKKIVDSKNPSENVLVRRANIFLMAAKESELDPRFLFALAHVVSNDGTNEYVRTYNNPYAIKYKGRLVTYASLEDGIIEGAKFIKHFYYMKGSRYSLIQMATNMDSSCTGSTYNPFNGWHIRVAKYLASRKMPNNSKAKLFIEGPVGTKDVIPEVDGKAVYKDGVNATSLITKISSIFSNMFNAIFGFSTGEDEEEFVDDDSKGQYIHANGHPFTCYCEKCHPEMYTKSGKPKTIQSILYQYAATKYYDVVEKTTDTKDLIKLTEGQNATKNILSKIYELSGFTNRDIATYGITTDNFSNLNAIADISEQERIKSLYSKFFLLGGLYKKGLLTDDIMAPSKTTSPILTRLSPSIWKYNSDTIKYGDMSSFSEILENGLDVYDVNGKEKSPKGAGLTLFDAKNMYNTMLMLYNKYTGNAFNESLFDNSSSYKTGVSGYVNRAKSIYNQLKGIRPDLFKAGIGYIPSGVTFSSDKYANNSDIARYQKDGIPFDKHVITKKLLFEKTNTFNPMNVKDITITPYKKSSSAFAPEFYLANATVTGKSNKAFMTNFLGIPVYGIGTIDGANPAWSIANYDDSTSDAYKNSYGVNTWNIGPQVTSFKNQLGIGYQNKSNGTRNDPYIEYRRKAVEKATSEGRPDKIDYYYHKYLKAAGIDVNVSLEESTNQVLPSFELKYIAPTGQIVNKTLIGNAKDRFYSDYYNAAVRLNKKSGNTNTSSDMDLVTTVKSAYSAKDSAIESVKSATNNFFQTANSDYYVDTDTLGVNLDGTGSGLGSFVSQLDPRYANMRFNTSRDTVRQTLGEAGCAPAVAAMAINNYTGGASMMDMSRAALKYKVKNGGTSSDYFSDVFARNGISSSYTSNQSDIIKSLKGGNSVVLLGQDANNNSKANSPFGPGGHYVLANGISADGSKIYVSDPELSGPTTYSSKILKNTNLGVTVGGGSGLLPRRFVGMGSFTRENRSWSDIVRQNLAKFSSVTAKQMNDWIKSKRPDSPFVGKGSVFIEASKRSGLDPRYILAHAAVESAWGTSKYAKQYHNYFGIGAFDSNPDNAKNYNHSTLRDGIINGAIWIAKNYYKKGQTSIYKMRYNGGVHEYCTSTTWVQTIGTIMANGPTNTKYSYTLKASNIKIGSTIKSSNSSSNSSSSSSNDSSVISAFQSRVSNMFNAAFGIDSSSGTTTTSSVSDGSWIGIVKAVKKAIAKKKPGYSQTRYINIKIDGTKYKVRTDCSGFVSACLAAFGVLNNGEFYVSTDYANGTTVLKNKLTKAGFKMMNFPGWNNLQRGDILAIPGHVEIFSTNKNGKHYVYNCGSDKSVNTANNTISGHSTYKTIWRLTSGAGSLLTELGSTLSSNISSSVRNGVRSRGSVSNYVGLGTMDKTIRLLSGKGYTRNAPVYTPDGKRSYISSGSGSTTGYTSVSRSYDENYGLLDNGVSMGHSNIKNFNSYANTSGYGTTNRYTSNYYNRELINGVGGASVINSEIQALIASCAKYLASIAANSKQMKTVVALLTKIVTKSASGSSIKSGSGNSNDTSSNSTLSSPTIIMNNNNTQEDFNDPGLEAMIKQLSELAQ